jgi:CubicO group peptidase (beta-lactamase class C family)
VTVHPSVFSLLSSCSRSVLGSGFWVRGSGSAFSHKPLLRPPTVQRKFPRVMERNRYPAPILALVLTTICAYPPKLAGQANRDALRVAMAKRIDEAKQGTGAVVGLLTPQGRSFATYGRMRLEGPEATPDTIFEIGSITKVFTSFLLADMVERGEVLLDDPVRKFLPSAATVPSRNGKQITLVDLATQTSGLPRDSVTVDLTATTSPYADYSANQLYAFLGGVRLDRDPGSKYEYSNVGMGLLGLRSRYELASATRTYCGVGFWNRSA